MICDSCKSERLVSDFINNQNICFRCIYHKKLEKSGIIRTDKPLTCRMCGKQIPHKKNAKKRQKTVFCSYACAEKGHRELNNKYWTKQVPSMRVV